MGSASSHEEEENHQKKELEKEKDNPDNKKLDSADFKVSAPAQREHRLTKLSSR